MQQIRVRLTKTIAYSQMNWFKRYQFLAQKENHHVLLESGRGGRYHIIGLRPCAVLTGKNQRLHIKTEVGTDIKEGDILELAQGFLQSYQIHSDENEDQKLPDFKGGAIGYISYDVARQIEHLPDQTEDDLKVPDLHFLIFEDFFVFDKETEELILITHAKAEEVQEGMARLTEYVKLWEDEFQATIAAKQEQQIGGVQPVKPVYSMDEPEFIDAVQQVQEYIRNGDVFQVNLSIRQSQCLQTTPFMIYESLRDLNPSPYMGYFHTPQLQLVNGSPELLIKKKGVQVSTRPIAGTRSRGKNFTEDEKLARSLIENEKERAEHVMLVDLERNDLGRVCEYGTIVVDEFMAIEKYSHVMHIVSNVKGKLQPNRSAVDLIRATFPGGTITGAPKIRTMEIIDELEPVRRGVYTGSIGWIGFDGDMELNIAIRTMVCKDGVAHVQAGAGIVNDSNPKAEYKESLKKAKALWYAKQRSEQRRMEKR